MKILIISHNFPDLKNPNKYVFLQKTYDGLINDNSVRIIAPRPIYYKVREKPEYANNIIRPYYISFFAKTKYFSRFFNKITSYFFSNSVLSGYKKLGFNPDVIYVHFLNVGFNSIKLSKKIDVPLIVGLGESSFSLLEKGHSLNLIRKYCFEIDFYICVSESIKNKIINEYKVSESKTKVLQNAVPDIFFRKYNKVELRKKYNFPLDIFIVSFLGHFVDRKGPQRVLESIENLENTFGIFIGEGKQIPTGIKVLFNKKVDYSLVPEILSCSDIFVFPTIAEGSSNAIIEAMACGLPLIVSNIQAIREQVTSENAIFIDPLNILEITESIQLLLENPSKREIMGKKSLEMARNHSIKNRTSSIMEIFNREKSNRLANK